MLQLTDFLHKCSLRINKQSMQKTKKTFEQKYSIVQCYHYQKDLRIYRKKLNSSYLSINIIITK